MLVLRYLLFDIKILKKMNLFGCMGNFAFIICQIDLFGLLNVVPNSNPLGIKRFVSGISISFKCECNIIMQIQYTKNLDPGRFELGTTLS